MTGDRPPDTTAPEPPPSEEDAAKVEAPADGAATPPVPVEDSETPREEPEQEAVVAADPVPPPGPEAADGAAVADAPTGDLPTGAPAPDITTEPSAEPDPETPQKEPDEVGAAAMAAAPDSPTGPVEAAAAGAPAPKAPPKPKAKRPPRPREPLPWPELRAAAAMAREDADVDELKELFRLLPNDVRDETVDGVREYRKGARRPVSAYAGKALARAVHTARRARRRPESDDAVSEAMGQALAAEVIASLDVEIAAEVILPKRDLLERESRNARRRQKAEDDKSRDERRRRAREESGQQGTKDGTYSGAKIRGLDQLAKLFDDEKKS